MSVRNLGFRDLQYMVAVADHQSFSRAAAACAITQPALSERIKRVETNLGVTLFERTKRTMRITPVGERLVAKARALLDELRDLEAIINAAHEPLSGPWRVGVIATLGAYLIPYILPALRRRYPKLELILQEGLTDALLAALKAGSLDVVIAAAPLNLAGIIHQPLFHEPFVLAAPADHPLARKARVKAADLHGEEMVLLEEGHCLSGQALAVCPVHRRSNSQRLHAMSVETLRHMVASGGGYTLLPWLAVVGHRLPLPRSSLPRSSLNKLVRYVPLDGKQRYGRNIVIAYRDSFSRESDVKLFAELIQKAVPEALANDKGQQC